ncbi:MAG TPA: molybdopterin-dependent oxidoreductase [Acidimicrobiales bacterium]|nr:molybdopterin-dependent oxidoreductase [Acidimicrobiales bacterium]
MTEPAARRVRLAGAGAGIVAGAFGLAVAHLVTAAGSGLRDPAVSVGDRLIDHVPLGVREWAIRTFATSDKAVLLTGVYFALVVAAAYVGLAATTGHRFRAGASLAGLGVAGAWAAVASPTAGLEASSPTIVGVAATGAVLWWLTRPRPGGRARSDEAFDGGRRQIVAATAAVAVGALAVGGLGAALRRRFSVGTERLAVVLPRAKRQRPQLKPGLEATVPNVSPLVTPNASFYRIDTALFVPTVSKDSWRLRIHGMVNRELTLTYVDLLARDLIETDVTIACVSNEVGGRLVGNARWLGARLDDLLADAGIKPRADQVVGRSIDGWTSGFPVAALDGRDAIVAVGMNGEPLPVRHGYPARLIVPGLYGYVSATKWLSDIELTRFDRFSGYWIPRGWAPRAPIKTESRIDTPDGTVRAGRIPIAGVAWAGTRGIDRVEVRVDGGPWQPADLGPELARTTWRQWWLAWDAAPGTYDLTVRATDGDGVTQTGERATPIPDGATGWHSRRVTVT